MRKKIIILLICTLLISITTTSSAYITQKSNTSVGGNTYYVSTTGNDNNLGTLSSPWKTIQKAMNAVSAGDTVIVRGGTYSTSTMSRSGTSSVYITFKNYAGETPIVDGSIQFTGSYCILDGFKIQNAPLAGVSGSGCSYVTVKNCYTTNTGWSGVRFDNGAHHITVDNNYITHSNTKSSQEALTFEKACHDLTITHNTIDNVAKEGIDCKVGCYNVVIAYNDVAAKHPDIYIDSYTVYSHDFEIYGNNCHGGGTGICMGMEQSSCAREANFYIHDNTLKSSGWGFSDLWESSCGQAYADNVKIMNNIFAGGMGIRINPPVTSWTNVVIRGNTFS
ncbi:MAG: DUF1565 domain-containing protein, partial [Candidatus Thermoplasmatota archaeon]|nr:DUF1565 domain-containing protein [Candidatus Thermoplasmatota archaeon]